MNKAKRETTSRLIDLLTMRPAEEVAILDTRLSTRRIRDAESQILAHERLITLRVGFRLEAASEVHARGLRDTNERGDISRPSEVPDM